MREYEEGYPVDANDRYYQGEHPGPDSRNSSNFGFANVKRNAVPGGNKVREDATDYLNERLKVLPYESTEVLFDQRVEFANEGEPAQIPQLLPFSVGDSVKVTWNGAEYECIAFDGSAIGEAGSAAVGNLPSVTGVDTGEPFAIATVPVAGLTVVLSHEETTEASVKIEGTAVKTIDPKYLPETGAGFNVNVWYENGEYVSNKTYEQIKAAEAAKTPITGTLTIADGKVFTLIGADSSAYAWVNLVAFNLNRTPSVYVYRVEIFENADVAVEIFSVSGTKVTNTDVYPK